ncbi:uncharacterized protein LOC119105362 [Pollicipes pollicipes]|uniref:uncharacterized protein LOC119105362 n=1 Tax=Pollicipes pollicipes TaxID=41117 RepID=UPI001884BF92|nr:uncharacterized protein LOC119105362 [Pollicipes pollicipes]
MNKITIILAVVRRATGDPVAFRPNLKPYPRQYIRLGLLGPDPDLVKQRPRPKFQIRWTPSMECQTGSESGSSEPMEAASAGAVAAERGDADGLPERHSSHDVFYELHEQHAVHVTGVRSHGPPTCRCGLECVATEGGRLVSRATQSPSRVSFVHKNLLMLCRPRSPRLFSLLMVVLVSNVLLSLRLLSLRSAAEDEDCCGSDPAAATLPVVAPRPARAVSPAEPAPPLLAVGASPPPSSSAGPGFSAGPISRLPARLATEYSVTLATQASLDRLSQLAELAERWTGPISAAVFAPDVEHALVRTYVAYLRRCSAAVRERVTFSLLIPAAWPARPDTAQGRPTLPCHQPRHALNLLLQRRPRKMLAWRERFAYPQNALRNLARKTSQTAFVYSVDVDVVPAASAARALDAFVRSDVVAGCRRCVFVVPTYEVEERQPFPETAAQLLELVRRRKARPFHEKVFLHNQFATNNSRWEKHVLEFTETRIIHPVTNFEFFYEPFYVSRGDVPEYDERFVGYGFTRNTQAYETLCAGYTFHVLAPVFAVHWGLQSRKARPPWREMQNNSNRRLFDAFKQEVFARFGTDPLGMMKKKPSAAAGSSRRKQAQIGAGSRGREQQGAPVSARAAVKQSLAVSGDSQRANKLGR